MDLFDVFARIFLDTEGYEKGLDQASWKTSKFGKMAGTALKAVGTVAVAAMAAGGAAAVAVGKQALDNYKTYEQLAGGAELLFGDAYKTVADNAATAYKRVQISQNEYLKQVNGFATGLKKSLGGNEQAAAELADKIIQAEADIVAATGATQESVQNAFNGVMRGNYMMLDNLQLGITPTKKGFQQVIKEVNNWNKANGRATKYQMGNLADMQAALVDYVEMVGLAGYAQKEAAGTIEGALSSTKAAWSDLLTGFANEDADLDGLISNLIDQATDLADQIMPRIKTVMSGLSKFLGEALPEVVPLITQFISENANDLASAGVQILTALIVGFVTAIPEIVNALPALFEEIGAAIEENGDELKQAGSDLLNLIWQGITEASTALWEWVQSTASMLGKSFVTEFGNMFNNIWSDITYWAGELVKAGLDLVNGLIQGMQTGFESLITNIATWVNENIITPLRNGISEAFNVGAEVVEQIKSGISSAWSGLKTWFNGIWDSLFGKRTVNINVNKQGPNSAIGIDYVPANGFPAVLHRGEAVLTAREAEQWRRGNSNGASSVNIVQNISSVPQTPVQLAAATAAYFEQARWAI